MALDPKVAAQIAENEARYNKFQDIRGGFAPASANMSPDFRSVGRQVNDSYNPYDEQQASFRGLQAALPSTGGASPFEPNPAAQAQTQSLSPAAPQMAVAPPEAARTPTIAPLAPQTAPAATSLPQPTQMSPRMSRQQGRAGRRPQPSNSLAGLQAAVK